MSKLIKSTGSFLLGLPFVGDALLPLLVAIGTSFVFPIVAVIHSEWQDQQRDIAWDYKLAAFDQARFDAAQGFDQDETTMNVDEEGELP